MSWRSDSYFHLISVVNWSLKLCEIIFLRLRRICLPTRRCIQVKASLRLISHGLIRRLSSIMKINTLKSCYKHSLLLILNVFYPAHSFWYIIFLRIFHLSNEWFRYFKGTFIMVALCPYTAIWHRIGILKQLLAFFFISFVMSLIIQTTIGIPPSIIWIFIIFQSPHHLFYRGFLLTKGRFFLKPLSTWLFSYLFLI